MVKRHILKIFGMILAIVFFAIFVIYTKDTGDPFFLIAFLIAIFLILNSRRYIKYRKWYVDISLLVPSLSTPKEKAILLHAWIYLLIGIILLILITIFPLIEFLQAP